jgi:hypothetical protein
MNPGREEEFARLAGKAANVKPDERADMLALMRKRWRDPFLDDVQKARAWCLMVALDALDRGREPLQALRRYERAVKVRRHGSESVAVSPFGRRAVDPEDRLGHRRRIRRGDPPC